MSKKPNPDDSTEQDGQPKLEPAEDRAGEGQAPDEELPRFPEDLRRAILESEARVLASWKKRGLFGLTTSTG
jgi:hypothetical protein